MAESEAALTELCLKLGVDESLKSHTRDALRQLERYCPKDETKPWICGLLYSHNLTQRFPYGSSDPQGGQIASCFTVSQLLKEAGISILEFFNAMKQIKECQTMNEVVMTSLVDLEKKYCVTSPLFLKFESIFDSIFQKDEDTCKGENENNPEESYNYKKSLCWTLFVYVKEVTMSSNQELILSFQLLLCCIDHVATRTPVFLLKTPYDSLKVSCVEKPGDGGILRELCSTFSITFEEVSAVKTSYLDATLDSIQGPQALELDTLTSLYISIYIHKADIDELLFLKHDPHLVVMETPTRAVVSSDQLVPVSPSSSMLPPSTPVRAALCKVQNLQNLLSSSIEEPSPALRRYFENCGQTPAPGIEDRVETMRSEFMDGFSVVMGREYHHLATRRFQLALRLYYRELEALLKLEEEQLSMKDFGHLLHNGVFHRCLFSCCMEVVLVTYAPNFSSSIQSPSTTDKNSGYSFPWVLNTFSVKAYDFFKVMDSFIRAEPRLAKEIIKHLHKVEQMILDSLAWQEGSPLFEALAKYEALVPTIPQSSPIDLNQNNNASTAQLYMSPLNARSNIKSPLGAVPNITMNRSPSKPLKSHSLNLFFNKVCRLAYQRLQTLCNLLALSKDLHHKIWSCVEFVISKKHDLLRDRHLDQILMCSIYALCKVASDLDIKFMNIVSRYRCLPHSSQQVYKHILVGPGEWDTIINFYNKVYMQTLKNHLMQYSTKPLSSTIQPQIPQSPITHNLQASPIFALPGRNNFFLSPLKQSPFKVPQSPSQLTPRTRQLYSFGERLGSSEKLKEINDSIKASSFASSKSQKRLKFDQPDSEQSSPNISEMIVVKRITPKTQTRKSLSFTEEKDD